MKVYCGILHDTYPDENGKEIVISRFALATR